MTRRPLAVAIMALLCAMFAATSAHARHQKKTIIHSSVTQFCGDRVCSGQQQQTVTYSSRRHSYKVSNDGADPRPGKWCMWWLRRELRIPISAFWPGEQNLARSGRYIGSAAHGPAVGVIVVWRHHVGIITGRTDSGWIVKSGNDGHAVRERERSLRGVIAYRWPNGMASR